MNPAQQKAGLAPLCCAFFEGGKKGFTPVRESAILRTNQITIWGAYIDRLRGNAVTFRTMNLIRVMPS